MPDPVLLLQDIGFAYPGQPPLANGWCLSVPAGVTLLHGDTGTGKSTLLRLMAGELPAAGKLTLAGVALDDDPEAYRRKRFWCDPSTDAFDQVTARACTATLRAGDEDFDEAEWRTLVEGFALSPHIDKPMYMLSTGSKRKIWLAAALASGRPLTLLDEPTGALDTASIRCLAGALARTAERPGRAIVVASSAPLGQVVLAGRIDLPLRSGAGQAHR